VPEAQWFLFVPGTDGERWKQVASSIQLAEKSLGFYPIPFRVVQPVRRFLTRSSEISTPHLAQQV
jgi:hypothetical protein